MRGPLAPAEAPISRTRAERFDEFVRDEAHRLEQRWSRQLSGVEFAVEEVPVIDPYALEPDAIPLSRLVPAADGRPARIVIYRRPIEARAGEDERDRARLIRDVVVEEVAELLGLSPESIDPTYDSPDD
jgi:predicted Zn-dependent protease with MMP-like domain